MQRRAAATSLEALAARVNCAPDRAREMAIIWQEQAAAASAYARWAAENDQCAPRVREAQANAAKAYREAAKWMEQL